jgi:hypothetical protein
MYIGLSIGISISISIGERTLNKPKSKRGKSWIRASLLGFSVFSVSAAMYFLSSRLSLRANELNTEH